MKRNFNKQPLIWGMLLLLGMLFVIFGPQTPSLRGSPIDSLPVQLLLLIMAGLLITAGIWPDSAPGRWGGMIFEFYRNIKRRDRADR